MNMPRLEDKHSWLWPLSLILLPLLFWSDLAFRGRILVGVDMFTYFYPLRDYTASVLRSGHLPLWNPYLFSGVPLLANIQAGVFYPVHLLLLPFSTPTACSLFILLHLMLAGLGMYGFGRRVLGLSPAAAWVAGVLFGLSGFLSAQAEHINQLAISALLPWMLWALDAFLITLRPGESTARRIGRGGVLAGLLAVAFLAGHTQSWYIALWALAGYVFLRAALAAWEGRSLREGWGALWPAAVGLAGAVLAALALCAVQLLPTLELSQFSIRAGGMSYREVISFSLKPQLLLRAFLPGYGEAVFSEYAAYVGWAGLFLAGVGLFLTRDWTARILGIFFALLGLFLAFGGYNPFYYLLYRLVPGFAMFRAPARWLLLYVVGMAILAGLGMDHLFSGEPLWEGARRARAGLRRWRWACAVVILAAALSLVLALARGWMERPSWLTLGGWGAALLALLLIVLATRRHRLARPVASALLLLAELYLAGRALPLAAPTAWDAFASLRTAPAHILAAGMQVGPDGRPAEEGAIGGAEEVSDLGDPTAHWGAGAPTFRFLSMSGIQYDPGDLADMRANWGELLPEKALHDFVVAAKQKEVIAPNLSLLYRIAAVDGYDGGVLPLDRYVDMLSLFLPEEDILPDGRLREQLRRVPPARLLALFNVEYVITDKVWDVWVDHVFYDLQFGAEISADRPEVMVENPYTFPAGEIGLISHLEGAAEIPADAVVAHLYWRTEDGAEGIAPIRAGRETAEGRTAGNAASGSAKVALGPDANGRQDYVARLELGTRGVPTELRLRWVGPAEGRLVVRGLSLIDGRTGAHRSLVVSDEGRFRLVHSGDVKIYRNLENLPRAYLVGRGESVEGDAEAIARLGAPSFDPGRLVLLHDVPAEDFGWDGPVPARILRYRPEEMLLQVDAPAEGYMVLSDAWYPGWHAFVDGQETPVLRANLLFRAVRVPAGAHEVRFVYAPASVRIGAIISLASLVLMAGAWGLSFWSHPRRRAP